MIGKLKTLAAAALLAATASMAGAAPFNSAQPPGGGSGDILLAHGDHRDCRRGPAGWHRHNRYGERRRCREWDGEGRRPDFCVRVGPIWVCDY